MATRLKPVDVVTVGVGWAGSILGKELAQAGLKVVGLERGDNRTQADFALPQTHDQYKYDRQLELFEQTSRSTLTFRNDYREVARPMRRHGPFPWGQGVGGAGFHWAGWTWRHHPWDFKTKKMTTERYGANAIPTDATIQDWPMTYEELEPSYDKFEYTCGISGTAGNIQGTIRPGGNPFETGNYELRSHAAVQRINVSGNRATSVTHVDAHGREFEQPADIILLTAFTWSNTHLLLLSGLGKPYDPATGTGVVGKNYAWHAGLPYIPMQFDKEVITNPFMGAGALCTSIADLQGDNFDHAGLGFVGGAIIQILAMGWGPLTFQPTPPGTPTWGSAWKKSVAYYYNRSAQIVGLHDHLSYRGNYLSLDPTYRDYWGNPLLRLTYDFGPTERKLSQYLTGIGEKVARAMGASHYGSYGLGEHFDAGGPYGIIHQVGGAMTGSDPTKSVANRYLQSWNAHNVFVVGASAFPQISSFNPTGTVGALAYWTADAIKDRYLRKPGPLV